MNKTCIVCGAAFVATDSTKYCSDECRKNGKDTKRRVWQEQHKKYPTPKLKRSQKPKISIEKAVKLCEKYGKTYGQLQKEGII